MADHRAAPRSRAKSRSRASDRPSRPAGPRARTAAPPAWAGIGFVLAAAVWLRASVLRYPFFADDYLFLDQTRGGSILSAWTVRDPLRNYWRPLSRQVYFWVVSALGESPVVAHVMNLALFLGILALLYLLTRKLAGERAALVATAIVALHEVADVPVLWASGSQDLLAIAGALAAICLAINGRVGWAVIPFLCGLLSKETAIVTPLITLWMLRQPNERWRASLRRVAPLFVATAVWLPVWLLMMRGGAHQGLNLDATSVPAALAHLPQAFFGIQWGAGVPPPFLHSIPPIVPLVLALIAVGLAMTGRGEAASTDASPSRGVSVGLVWAALAALPVSIVVHVWSSYYYFFASCGLALALATLVARAPTAASLAVIALVAWGSESARATESFETKPGDWGTQSHLSRFYFDRSMRWVSRYLEDLRRQRPTIPHHSTLFFAGTPAFASWQSGNGALVRWVYRDSTLQSYYFADFTRERARRGEYFMFIARNDSLIEERGRVEGLLALASGQMLSERFATAHEAIACAIDVAPGERNLHYWNAWLGLALGDSTDLRKELLLSGCEPRTGPTPELAVAKDRIAAGRATDGANQLASALERHALDPELHALLADVLLQISPRSSAGAMEALIVRLLEPRDPQAWRRWAHAQVATGHPMEAYDSMNRYFELAGPEARQNADDVRLLELLRQSLPGGNLAQAGLRLRPEARK